jgi:2-polyprenyl-3-methyl-5-hydroxy-6-metoxy-1,4-benzoquinol methylase
VAETDREPSAERKFDAYSEDYQALHATSVGVSGEGTEYFAEYKLRCLTERLGLRRDDRVLDFGCGIGNLTALLARGFDFVHGFDPSEKSLAMCAQRAPSAILHGSEDAIPDGTFQTAILSGVLHHVPVDERVALLRRLRRKLQPSGRLVVFEHNPLNPLTRWAVKMCPFDDDAVLLWPWEARRTLERAGYARARVEFIVFFPRALQRLRPLEPLLRGCPLGAQVMVVADSGAAGQ